MKFKWKITSGLIVILLSFAIVFSSTTTKPSLGIMGQADFKLSAELPESPAKLPRYRIVGDESQELISPELPGGPRDNLPSDEEAIKKAKLLLEKLGIAGDVKLEKVSREYVERVENGKVVEKKAVLVDVIFRRYIDGMLLFGPGGEIEIFLGENGKVLGYLKPWKNVEYDGEVELITAKQAYEKLKRWEVENKPTEPLKLTVVKVEAGYYAKPPASYGSSQEYYEPVWIFHCKDEFNNTLRLAVKAVKS